MLNNALMEQFTVENDALRVENDALRAQNAQLLSQNAELTAMVAVLTERVAELERRLAADSSNSSRPPSSDAPWAKKPARKRSLRVRSGRKPGKQPGAVGSSRHLRDDWDELVLIEPHQCEGCGASLDGAGVGGRQRRQVIDVPEPPPLEVTEYQRLSKICPDCARVTTPAWDSGDDNAAIVAMAGSPVRIGPEVCARVALLSCAHYLPVGRSRQLLQALSAIEVSSGFVAGVRGRAARRLEQHFLAHMRTLLASVPVLHADETTGRANAALSWVHVACTEYLTLMHVGGRAADDIDAGGVLTEFSGVLMRDGYAGYTHLPAIHAWCAAHLLRDLRSISDGDPDAQVWATAMATVLLDANSAAAHAREHGADALDAQTLADIANRYLGALALGTDENRSHHTELAVKANTLIARFRRYQDMILRFATDLSVPFTNNEAERALRPIKVQQRSSGGAWRTLQGLTDFAIVHSYLDTANKWGINKLDALRRLFTTGPWLPPALTPS